MHYTSLKKLSIDKQLLFHTTNDEEKRLYNIGPLSSFNFRTFLFNFGQFLSNLSMLFKTFFVADVMTK